MLKIAVEHGTTDIVAASRANFEYPFDPQVIAQRTDEIRAQYDGSIRIHAGCALHFGLGNIRDALANPHKYAINGRAHLLLEFSDVVIPPATEEILGKFRTKGIVPVIGHPERNPILQRCPERLQAWISMGCVLQVTARSLSGHFGPIEQRYAWNLFGFGHGACDRERRARCPASSSASRCGVAASQTRVRGSHCQEAADR